jgi:Holliday junction resolvasome RuvABC DNA-binding subunit
MIEMRFRSPRDSASETTQTADPREAEEVRVREWQAQRLSRLGYESKAASQVVRAAWGEGEHTDLVHRIEELIGRGATLDQAARIVAPVAHVVASERDSDERT